MHMAWHLLRYTKVWKYNFTDITCFPHEYHLHLISILCDQIWENPL